MATVPQLLLRLAQRVDPRTKQSQQTFQEFASAAAITSSTNATPIVVTSTLPHALSTGDSVFIYSHLTNTNANNTSSNPAWTITKVSDTTFSLDGSVGNGVGSAGFFVGAMVGSALGNFTGQRLLDIYNEARFTLFGALWKVLGPEALTKAINGNVVYKTDLTFATGVANKPTGYVRPIYLTDSSDRIIPIIPTTQVAPFIGMQTTTERFVIEKGTTLFSPSGTTYVADAATYKLMYYGITTWVLFTNVLVASPSTEEFIEDYHYMLMEIAEAIAHGQGMSEVNSVAKQLLGAK
jgi:hypothetical protein